MTNREKRHSELTVQLRVTPIHQIKAKAAGLRFFDLYGNSPPLPVSLPHILKSPYDNRTDSPDDVDHEFTTLEFKGAPSSPRHYAELSINNVSSSEFPAPNATAQVKSVIKKLSTKGPRENLEKFTSFRTRCKFYSFREYAITRY